MPFDTRLDTDVAGSRFDAAFDGSTGAQFRTAGEFQPAAFSFEALERLATFGYSSHQLTCCACGEDHSGELLAHKISLAVAGSSVAGTAPQGGTLSAPPGSPESQTFNLSGEVDGSTLKVDPEPVLVSADFNLAVDDVAHRDRNRRGRTAIDFARKVERLRFR